MNEFWLRPDVTAAMGFWRDRPEYSSSIRKGAQVDFRPALVDSRLFSLDVFRRVSAKQLRGLERRPASYKESAGKFPPSQGDHQAHAVRYPYARQILPRSRDEDGFGIWLRNCGSA
jgi:hypothetical protein